MMKQCTFAALAMSPFLLSCAALRFLLFVFSQGKYMFKFLSYMAEVAKYPVTMNDMANTSPG